MHGLGNAHDSPAKNSRISRLQREINLSAVFANLNATRHLRDIDDYSQPFIAGTAGADKYFALSVNMSKN